MTEGVDIAALGHAIASEIRARLVQRLAEQGPHESVENPADLKATHAIDHHAAEVAARALADYRCNLFIEGHAPGGDPAAPLSFYMDPVDGSMNWDRRTGDPAFVMACCRGPWAPTLDEFDSAYVEGLASGDRYWAQDGRAHYHCALTGRTTALAPQPKSSLRQATGYLRFGYGGAVDQLAATIAPLLEARDMRAMDNAAIEFCEIARGAAGFMVEARGLSDGYNLLAWPIVRAAGGALLDLDGAPIAPQSFTPDHHRNYVLASSPELAAEVVQRIRETRDVGRQAVDLLGK